MEKIDISEFKNIYIGQVEDVEKGTGMTVFLSKEGMPAGLDVRGGGPASRDSQLLSPLARAGVIHGIVLAGGSAYGLDSAGGVMQYMEEQDLGYNVAVAKVPLICQSGLFDLAVGDPKARPGKEMGYEAAKIALNGGNFKAGNYGAGCGATVGKFKGIRTAMKSGIGSYAVKCGELMLGAVVVVNAFGDIYENGKIIAGFLNDNKDGFANTEQSLFDNITIQESKFFSNTTLAVVMTNAKFEKTKLCKIAGMAQDGLARAIIPVHTNADGDSVYAVSLGEVDADMDVVGSLAANVVEKAIIDAVKNASPAYGLKAASDFE